MRKQRPSVDAGAWPHRESGRIARRRLVGLATILVGALVASKPADAVPCGFDDPSGPNTLCEVSFDGTWRPASGPTSLGGQPNRTNVLGTITPSPPNSFFNNFSAPVGIDFHSDRDFEGAYFASRGTPLLTILGFLGGTQVASHTIDFNVSGFFVFAHHAFDSSFDQVDALEFHPTTFGFPPGFGEFFMDDANIVATAPPTGGTAPAPGTLALVGLGLLLGAVRRSRS